jgi:membrane protease YdiL (CAAX protease family)
MLASGSFQEVLMRGYPITRLEDLWENKWAAFAVSVILFGVWHVYQGGFGTVASVVFGAVYGLLFLRFRRVWPLAAAHALINVLIHFYFISALAHWVYSHAGGMG